jgi:hypothetical protein
VQQWTPFLVWLLQDWIMARSIQQIFQALWILLPMPSMIPFNVEFFFNDYAGDDIIFTELYYFQPDGGIQNLDYFELYNKGDVAIELAGMQITTGIIMNLTQAMY